MTGPLEIEPLKVERHTRASRIALPIGVLVVLFGVSVPVWGSSNLMKTAVTFLTLVALAQMWNLLGGYGGMLSVGQQAYIGIAAYALWALAEKAHINPFLAVPIAAVIATAFAVPTAALAFRLRGGYFAVGTWVIAEVYKLIVVNTTWLGGGAGASITSAGKIDRDLREMVVYWLALLVAVGSIAVVYFLLRSRRGLALTAIRDDETGAEGLGVNVFRSKLWVYLIAAFGCGLTGGVIYLNLLRLQPEAAFGLNWSALMIFAVVIGGLGTIEGPIIGAIIFFALEQLLADYGTWYLIILGGIAAMVSVFAKRGLWGVVVRRWPVDLFPVRRRLCLETVCFPEEGPTSGGGDSISPAGVSGGSGDSAGRLQTDTGPAASSASSSEA